MVAWSENDALFRQELAQGFKWQLHVAQYLMTQGFQVEVPKLRFRETIEQAADFGDEPDILWEGRTFEVKSRNLFFTCPEDFPYSTILVDTVNGWHAKVHKPHEYICISTETGCMVCLGGETQPLWAQSNRWDHTREIMDNFYEAPTGLWMPMSAMISQMRSYKNRKSSS